LTDAAESQLSEVGSNDDLNDEFLEALAALGGSAGNGRLRDMLGWDEASYDAVKAELLSRGLIRAGRGRGGSVVLSDGLDRSDRDGGSAPQGLNGEHTAQRTRAGRGSGATRASNTRTGSASASRFETAFRAIDDGLRKEAGCGTELDDTEQTSWLLFLKYLDGLEDDRAAMALLEGRSASPILEPAYRWNSWAAPKDASGQLDHHAALSGDDLRDFVNQQLFPYLERFKRRAEGSNTIEYRSARSSGRSATRSPAATTCARSSI